MARATLSYLGPYRLLNVVHTGHFGQIWQAYHDGRQQMVGIKTLLEKFRRSREHVGSLRWEYKVGRSVVHPQILEFFSFDTDRGTPYIAMEWFSAPNLKNRITQGTEKIAHLLAKTIDQMAEAVAYFNWQGWVHRDLKPDNFLVNDQGDVKLIDFALACRIKRGLARWFCLKSKVQGTRTYMSPEQIRGEPLDQRADVYGFGCVVHELISGKPPFHGITTQELLGKHLKAPPPLLETVANNITPEFAQLVRRTLAKDPRERPQSMEEFLGELRRTRLFLVAPRAPAQPQQGGRAPPGRG